MCESLSGVMVEPLVELEATIVTVSLSVVLRVGWVGFQNGCDKSLGNIIEGLKAVVGVLFVNLGL